MFVGLLLSLVLSSPLASASEFEQCTELMLSTFQWGYPDPRDEGTAHYYCTVIQKQGLPMLPYTGCSDLLVREGVPKYAAAYYCLELAAKDFFLASAQVRDAIRSLNLSPLEATFRVVREGERTDQLLQCVNRALYQFGYTTFPGAPIPSQDLRKQIRTTCRSLDTPAQIEHFINCAHPVGPNPQRLISQELLLINQCRFGPTPAPRPAARPSLHTK